MRNSNNSPEGGLSHAQVRFFHEEGYFRLLDVLNVQQVELLRNFVHEQKRKEDISRATAGEESATKLYGLLNRAPELVGEVIYSPKLIQALWSILGPNVVLVTNRHNHATVNDAAGTKNEARLHRDILQPTRGLLSAAVYLEDATPENGCTHILPGSHRLPYVGMPQLNGGGTWMDEHEEYAGLEGQAIPIAMPAGSILLFTGLAFHSVGLNTSGHTRTSMTFGFRAVDELDKFPDTTRQILIAGEYIYRGNDR